MSILAKITESAVKVLERDGISWKIRRVSSADIARAGQGFLLHVDPAALADLLQQRQTAPETSREAELRVVADTYRRLDPEKRAQMATRNDAIVCAGLVAVGQEGEWEEIRLVVDRSRVDVAKGIGCVSDLPAKVRDWLATEILTLSHDEEGLSALAAFRSAG